MKTKLLCSKPLSLFKLLNVLYTFSVVRTFQDVLKDTVHFQFFKRYLKAHRADNLLNFWNAVEGLRVADRMKLRQMKAQSIVKKYFHNPKIPANKLLQCNADIIKYDRLLSGKRIGARC